MKDKGQGKKSKPPKDSQENKKILEAAMNILIEKNEKKNEKVGPSFICLNIIVPFNGYWLDKFNY